MDLIASSVLSSQTATVTFSSLNTVASAYRDLVLVVNALGFGGNSNPALRFNSDSSNSYDNVNMRADSFGVGSSASNTQSSLRLTLRGDLQPTTSERALYIANIFDFSQTTKHKTCISRANNATVGGTEALAQRWANLAAITSISVVDLNAQFASTSRFHLYGIKA